MTAYWTYVTTHVQQILSLTMEHIEMTAIAVGIAILVGVPLGILISYIRGLSKPILGAANVVQAIPSMALLGLGIPLLGIGKLPAIVMVIIYSLLPIIKNTYTGIANIDHQTVESASAIGMTRWQVLWKIKIPLALPIIMAGVRISAVTAVGTMTMAAFIGAGGLGYLIFAGIRTVNNAQILAGAVPACILALLVDYMIGALERIITPFALQKDFTSSDDKKKKRHLKDKVNLSIAVLLIIALIGTNIATTRQTAAKEVTIGGKDFTEQEVLLNLYGDYVEAHTDLTVTRKSNLGGSQVAYEALKDGEIDSYIDYTGTVYGSIFAHKASTDMKYVYDTCKTDLAGVGITEMDQCAFNNTYALAVSEETAKKYNLTTLTDVAEKADQLTLGSTIEFQNREDCMVALKNKYPGLTFKKLVAIDGSPRYTALENKEVDVVDAWTTDGMLQKYHLVVMKDDTQVFPPYYAVPLINSKTLKKYPELGTAMNELSPHLTEKVMSKLNYEVDVQGKDPAKVAHTWLEEQDLI